jgi:hypothetical protein
VVIEKLNKLTLSYSVLIQEHPGRRLLDFGGGTGVFCEIAHELGRYVTYLDIPGLVSEFARWRFWEYQLPIGVQIASPENPAIVGSTTSLLRRGSGALARKKQILVAVHTRIERHGFTDLQGDRHVCSVWQRRPEDRVEPRSIITGVGREREVRLVDRVVHF